MRPKEFYMAELRGFLDDLKHLEKVFSSGTTSIKARGNVEGATKMLDLAEHVIDVMIKDFEAESRPAVPPETGAHHDRGEC
jgi:hypothetical protein